MTKKPRMLSLCSGIGGIDLAAQRADFEIAGQVEIDDYCQAILAKHWPNVPKIRNIHDVQGHEFGHIDLIAGGIPCQPFSTAGRRRGKEDDRHLWPQMLRIIKVARPTWILIENVIGFINLALEAVLADLEDQGYQCQTFVFPACAIGAPHQRMRCFIVAYAAGRRCQQTSLLSTCSPCLIDSVALRDESSRRLFESWMGRAMHGVSKWLDNHRFPAFPGETLTSWEEPSVLPERIPMDKKRIHALGNAVVPQQVYPILACIAVIHEAMQS